MSMIGVWSIMSIPETYSSPSRKTARVRQSEGDESKRGTFYRVQSGQCQSKRVGTVRRSRRKHSTTGSVQSRWMNLGHESTLVFVLVEVVKDPVWSSWLG